jgi:hypothetical protein
MSEVTCALDGKIFLGPAKYFGPNGEACCSQICSDYLKLYDNKIFTQDEVDYGISEINIPTLYKYLKNNYIIKEHYMYDENYNCVNLIRHSPQKAIVMLDSLESCSNCEDCIKCKDCESCFNCVECINLEKEIDLTGVIK